MMETVHYDDEDPVTYKSGRDRVLFETLKNILGLTVREIHPMLERVLVDGLDPIEPDGEEFELHGVLEVPPPNAKVNLFKAKDACGRDIKACQMLLEGEMDRAELVLRNSIAWLRFWSVRGPTPEMRA